MSFDRLLAEAESLQITAWGDGFLAGRYAEGPPPWDWPDIVRRYAAGAASLLDLGTGDGARLAELAPLPPRTVAQEAWASTIPAAAARLRRLGVPVVHAAASPDNTDDPDRLDWPGLPFRDRSFDVVHSRHECFSPREVRRVLAPGGVFVTQQVRVARPSVRALLGLPDPDRWNLPTAAAQLRDFQVVESGTGSVEQTFADVGAFVAYLRSVPWEIPGFSAAAYRPRLAELFGGGTPVRARLGLFWLAARPR